MSLLYFLAEELPGDGNQSIRTNLAEEKQLEGYNLVVTVDSHLKLILHKSGVVYELLVPSMSRKILTISGKLAYGSNKVVHRLLEPTEEFIYLLARRLLSSLSSGEYVLARGIRYTLKVKICSEGQVFTKG